MSTIGAQIGEGRTAEIYTWGDHQVVKLFRAEMSSNVEHEARIAQIVTEVLWAEGKAASTWAAPAKNRLPYTWSNVTALLGKTATGAFSVKVPSGLGTYSTTRASWDEDTR